MYRWCLISQRNEWHSLIVSRTIEKQNWVLFRSSMHLILSNVIWQISQPKQQHRNPKNAYSLLQDAKISSIQRSYVILLNNHSDLDRRVLAKCMTFIVMSVGNINLRRNKQWNDFRLCKFVKEVSSVTLPNRSRTMNQLLMVHFNELNMISLQFRHAYFQSCIFW